MVKKLGFIFILGFLIAGCQPQADSQNVLPTATPTIIEEREGSIAFIGTDGNIYIIKRGGGSAERLTEDANSIGDSETGVISYREPTWSPAGDHLAYVRRESHLTSGDAFSLEVFHSGTGSSSEVFSSDEYYPFYLYWSPDGELLTFLTSGDGADLNLWVTNTAGEARVLDQGEPYYWIWLTDGKSLLTHKGGSIEDNPEAAGLQIVGISQSFNQELNIKPLNFQAPGLAKERGLVAVTGRQEQGMAGIYLLSSSGEVITNLMEVEGKVSLDFSPSGRYLAVVEGDDTGGPLIGSLTVLDLDDPLDPISLPIVDDAAVAFWWSPTEDRLLYFEPRLVPETDTQTVRYETQTNGTFRLRAQVYDPENGLSYPLMTFTPTQEFLRILHFYDQYQRSATIWSPDGQYVVYTAERNDGAPGVFVIDVSGDSRPQQVGEGILAYWSWNSGE